MTRALDSDFVARYGRPPAKTTTDKAISLHENVRALLGDVEYASVLQGSYKNDTALATMNDVDVLTVSRHAKHDWYRAPNWPEIFSGIERKLESDRRYAGKWTRKDKCIRLATEVSIDVVPAVHHGDPIADPISVYSFSTGTMRKNWPRGHHDAAAKKSAATNGAFKQTVRLYKRWARCRFGTAKTAPSYYLECLIYSLPNAMFSGDLPLDFYTLGREIERRHASAWGVGSLARLAGDGDLLSGGEWAPSVFRTFLAELASSLTDVRQALDETDGTRAKAAWRRAFSGHEP